MDIFSTQWLEGKFDYIITHFPNEWWAYVAVIVVAGLVLKLTMPTLHLAVDLVGKILTGIGTGIAAIWLFFAERREKRREFRRQNKMPNRS